MVFRLLICALPRSSTSLVFARTSPRLSMRLAKGSQYKTPSDDGSHAGRLQLMPALRI